jgi:hypothetical protein
VVSLAPGIERREIAAAHGHEVRRQPAMAIDPGIDIIGDGELTAAAREQLHREGLWPLYESLRQTAYEAFVSGHMGNR